MTTTAADPTDRDTAIRLIRRALRRRSGKSWSVTGGRGTVWGWITIHALPAHRDQYGSMDDGRRAELGELLGLGEPVHHQGVSIPAGSDYRREYVDRAEGRVPSVTGKPYWD